MAVIAAEVCRTVRSALSSNARTIRLCAVTVVIAGSVTLVAWVMSV